MPSARRFVPGRFPRLHLVTPAVVERTVARVGVDGILNERERAVFEGFPLERRRRDWIAGRLAAKRAIRAAALRVSMVRLPYSAITVWNEADGTAVAAAAWAGSSLIGHRAVGGYVVAMALYQSAE